MRHVHVFTLVGTVLDHWPHLIQLAAYQTVQQAKRLHVDPIDLTMWIDHHGDRAHVSFIGEHVCTGGCNPNLN